MRKLIKKAVPEKAKYTCDITGKSFGECGPETVLTLSGGYGSSVDGQTYEFHISGDVDPLILDLIQLLLVRDRGWSEFKTADHFSNGEVVPRNLTQHEVLTLVERILSKVQKKKKGTPKK